MRHRFALIVVLLAAVMAVSACGGSSSGKRSSGKAGADPAGRAGDGVAAKSPNAILTAATAAIDGVRSVRVTGSLPSGRSTIKLNLDLVAGKGATGTGTLNGLSFRLISVGRDVYIKGSSRFWRSYAGPAAAGLLQGRWLKAPATSGAFASLSSVTDLHKLVGDLLSGQRSLTKGATSVVDGHAVIALKDTSKDGTLYVATTGKPYPIAVVGAGSVGGRIAFSRFDEPVSLVPPARSIDITKLHVK